jgi:hypothetical protein
MKKLLLIVLVLITITTGLVAQTLVSYPSAVPYNESGNINGFPTVKTLPSKPVYYREGNTIKSYPSGNTSFVIDGNEIKSYPFGKTVYYLDGQNVKEFPTGNVLYVIDGEKVKSPSGDILFYKEENKIKRGDGNAINNNYQDGGSPLWIIACILNTGC